MAFLSAFQLANLAALSLVLAAPLLLFAYLKKKKGRERVVSSIIVLQTLKMSPVARRTVKPPLRFYLELLALLLLALAAASPIIKDNAEHHAIILDNSLSMRAQTGGGESRFSAAIERINKIVSEQSGDTSYTLYSSSPTLEQHGKDAISSIELTAALAQIKASLAADAIDSSVVELAESSRYEKVIVVTDKTLVEDPSLLSNDTPEKKSSEIQIHTVADLQANYFISNLRLRTTNLETAKHSLIATIGYSGPTDVTAKLSVRAREGNAVSQSDQPLHTKVLRLSPGKIIETKIDVPAAGAGKTVYKVELNNASSSANSSLASNSIAEDDIAWIAAGSAGVPKVLVVSPQTDSSQFGLSKISTIAPESITPASYAKLSPTEVENYSLLIFHQTAPNQAPEVPTLLILPPAENQLFPVLANSELPKITSWNNEHSLTSYLKVPLLKPAKVAVFDLPLWAQAVINVEQGTILAAGESRGVRFAAVGMELLPFEGGKTPSSSILSLNLLNWLLGRVDLSVGLLTASSMPLDGPGRWLIRTPDSETKEITVDAGRTEFFYLEKPGPYFFTRSALAGEKRESSKREILTVNSFFPRESATYSQNLLRVSASIPHKSEVKKGLTQLWSYLVVLTLLFLLAEFLLHLFGKDPLQAEVTAA